MDLDPERTAIPQSQLPRRNVEVYTSENYIVAGVWQYGRVTWDTFYTWMTNLLSVEADWAIFEYAPETGHVGEKKHPGDTMVQPGNYVLLSLDGGPTKVNPTPSKSLSFAFTPRDGKCLITGLEANTYSRLKAAHIFPRAHLTEWLRRGYANMITDALDDVDLHVAWDNYEFGVDPDNNYRITAFDPSVRPLDVLFRDHFMQGLLKHIKGAAEPTWDYDDFEDALGKGSFDLSKNMWELRTEKSILSWL
ncbi:hypothetical protein A0H81_00777 [Grifola frondosa]|uniref:HNH nuclease domain-containing protein n=1 Tax=Grifola frondosa TaxID=5627 RepID=A0A1C7MSE4_GRIFR|nr:hypothetical protein A0H81_00777 [Grifola frondosa]